jgi:hypothetical protein
MTTEDPEKIRSALDKLKDSSMEIGKAIYSQANANENSNSEEPE